MKLLLVALMLSACSTEDLPSEPDAGAGIRVPGNDLEPAVDAGSSLDAYDPFGDPPTALCSDVCPDEELTPQYNPANTYVWSYCRPSYRRCIDPTAPVCQGC